MEKPCQDSGHDWLIHSFFVRQRMDEAVKSQLCPITLDCLSDYEQDWDVDRTSLCPSGIAFRKVVWGFHSWAIREIPVQSAVCTRLCTGVPRS